MLSLMLGMMRWRTQLSPAHLWLALGMWACFTALTWAILRGGLDQSADRSKTIVVTTLATPLGPMTGAISRHWQDCCLQFSLSLLPYCASALAASFFAQLLIPPSNQWWRLARLGIWFAGLLVWFGGGIISFGHALS